MSQPTAEARAELLEQLRQAREARVAAAGTPMSKVEYTVARDRIVFLARMTLAVDFERLLLRIDRVESVGPFIDPTLYQRFLADTGAQAELKTLAEMARALLAVRGLAEQLIESA